MDGHCKAKAHVTFLTCLYNCDLESKVEAFYIWMVSNGMIMFGVVGNIQEVILQEHLEKEDEILVSLAGLKQVYCWTNALVYLMLLCYRLYCCPISVD